MVLCKIYFRMFALLIILVSFTIATVFVGRGFADEGAKSHDTGLRIATFSSDVTPPIGHPICAGYCPPTASIEDSLEAKGVVIEDGDRRYVLCAVDWGGLSNTAFDMFQQKIAKAAGTDSQRVAVQCLHLHTAPLADGYANEMLAKTEKPIAVHDEKFLRETTDRLARAVEQSIKRLEPFDSIGVGQAKVDRVASSRRIMVDGRIVVRGSSGGKDQKMKDLPEGIIDPMVKTVTFARGQKPLARLHYYATHPQSFYNDGRISSDVPGFARKRIEKKEGVFQVYFTGCGADVAMGKYNNGSREARDELTDRLQTGMEAAIAATKYAPVGPITWRAAPLLLPLRNTDRYNLKTQRKVLATPSAPKHRRIEAAEYLAFAQRIERPIIVSSLQMGDVFLLHLPGETFLEYQLYAQRTAPHKFVAVAGYGEYDPVYLCTEIAFKEGGYEPTEAMSGPKSEPLTKAAIRQLLGKK